MTIADFPSVADRLLGDPQLPDDAEQLKAELCTNRTNVELGLTFRAKELADRIRMEKERRRAVDEAFNAGIKQLETRLDLIVKALAMSLDHRVKNEGHVKTMHVPGAGVLRQRTVRRQWKVTDPDSVLEWCEHNKFVECLKPTLRAEVVQDLAKELMERAGGEIPPGLTDVPEHESTSFTAEGH